MSSRASSPAPSLSSTCSTASSSSNDSISSSDHCPVCHLIVPVDNRPHLCLPNPILPPLVRLRPVDDVLELLGSLTIEQLFPEAQEPAESDLLGMSGQFSDPGDFSLPPSVLSISSPPSPPPTAPLPPPPPVSARERAFERAFERARERAQEQEMIRAALSAAGFSNPDAVVDPSNSAGLRAHAKVQVDVTAIPDVAVRVKVSVEYLDRQGRYRVDDFSSFTDF